MPPASDIQALLAEDRWIRRLAARLVPDASTADDLVQETYVTALASDSRPRDPRAWLSGLLRNLWRDLARSGARRARRELGAARAEATSSTDELVAEVELRRRVAELVLELEEPLRRALILRFFKGCSLPALARHEQVSVSTAHERVERGLALLRARLDNAHGGGRRAWAIGLAALARGPSVGLVPGGLVMATGIKAAAASLVLVGTWVWLAQERRRASPAETVARAELPAQVEADESSLAELSVDRQREARVVEASSSAPDSPAGIAASLRGRVLDPRQAPLAGIPIGRSDSRWAEADSTGCESSSDGRFELPLTAESRDPRPVALTPGRATLACEAVDGEWLIVLTDTAAYSGRVIDEGGAPLGGVELSVEPRPGYFREHGYSRPLDPYQQNWKATSDDDGRFGLAAAPAGEAVAIQARAAGYPPTWTRVPAGREGDVCIVLARSEGVALTGIVIGPGGEPLAGARVSTGHGSEMSGADGSFTVLWRPSAVYTDETADGSVMRRNESHVNAVCQGYAPVHVPLAGLDVREPIVLQLGPSLSIRGRVVDTRGGPVSGVILWPADPTPLGDTVGGPATSDPFSFGFNIENSLRGGEGVCQTAEDGSFELDQLLERAYHLLAYDPRTATCAGPRRVDAGASGVVIELDRDSGVARIAGRLITADGDPLPGAAVLLTRPIPEDPGFLPPLETDGLTTDAEGRFVLSALAGQGARLNFFHPTFFLFTCRLEGFADLEHLEIVAPTLCELQIVLADPTRARRARVLDGEDQLLHALQFRGSEATMLDRLTLVEGKSEVVRVSDTARTLVLYQGEEEVERVPIRLDPGQRTTVRL